MPKKFTDFDLQVHRGLRKDWVQSFVDEYGHERNPHGQMKLLCSNLLGLALVEQHLGKRKAKIQLVVAGASPGTHMLVLLRHLRQWRQKRNVRITLYDPAALDPALQDIVNQNKATMKFEQRVFEDSDAEEWVRAKGDDCLVFFSDIRSWIHGKKEHMSADEALILADMLAQQQWVQTMQPDYCMLKFHAPHATPDGPAVRFSLKYLQGVLYEQAYAGLFSAEYRLFCTKANIKRQTEPYNTMEIEGHAFFHTSYTRTNMFSVERGDMRYDDAFAAHVAHKAARLLGFNAAKLLGEAYKELHVAPMQFRWHHARPSRINALLQCMQQI
jgi:hypothetical protein